MKTFKLRIVASNKVFFDDECQCLTIPYIDGGKMSFLPRHENCIVPIESGEMKIKAADDSVIEAFIGDGFIEFLDNEAEVVCVSVEMPIEIDKRRAEEAKIRAEEKLRQKQSRLEYNISKADLSRAMHRIKVKNRHEI